MSIVTYCDWCKEEFDQDPYGEDHDFTLESSVTVSYEGGSTGHKKGWMVEHLCQKCQKRLMNLLESSGIKITHEEIVW